MEAWSFSSCQYIRSAISNVEKQLALQDKTLPKRCMSPITRDYRPELDITPELGIKDIACYQSLIGILRWIVELGRFDITTEVSLLSSCMALPRQDHMDQLLNIFGYLKLHDNAEIVVDPSEPDIDEKVFAK